MANIPNLPNTLTTTQWKTKKSIITKALKQKTGITEALKDVETAHSGMTSAVKQVFCIPLPVKPAKKLRSNAAYTALKSKLTKLEKLATRKGDEFKKSKLVPKKTREYTQSIARAATSFAQDVNSSLDDILAAATSKEQVVIKKLKKDVKSAVRKAKIAVAKARNIPTPDMYNSVMGGNGAARTLATALRGLQLGKIDLGFDPQGYIRAVDPWSTGDKMTLGGDTDASEVKKAINGFGKFVDLIDSKLH